MSVSEQVDKEIPINNTEKEVHYTAISLFN
jgi:hypothetical protein